MIVELYDSTGPIDPGGGNYWRPYCPLRSVAAPADEMTSRIFYDTILSPYLHAVTRDTRSKFVSSTSPEWLNVKNGPKGTDVAWYFGNSYSQGEVAPEVRQREVTWLSKPRSSMKSWLDAKSKGEIVFRSYSIGKLLLIEQAGFMLRDVVNSSSTSYTRYLNWNDSRIARLPCGTNIYWPHNGLYMLLGRVDIPAAGGVIPLARVKDHYRRLVLEPGSLPVLPTVGTPTLSDAIDSFISQLKTVRPHRGLVTEVVCEANSGAYDILTSVAENIRETIPMIFGTAKKILQKYLDYRNKVRKLKRNTFGSGSLREDIANLWLQYRYAIKPMVYDLNDLLDYSDLEFERFRSYRKGSTEKLTFEHEGWSGSVNVVHRCLVRNRLNFTHFDGLQLNAFKTAWELLPTSLFVDWVINIGDVLSASIPPPGLDYQRINYSVRCSDVLELTNPEYPGATVRIEIDSYTSEPIYAGDYVGLSFEPNITFSRLTDAIAVVWGGAKKPLRYR